MTVALLRVQKHLIVELIQINDIGNNSTVIVLLMWKYEGFI